MTSRERRRDHGTNRVASVLEFLDDEPRDEGIFDLVTDAGVTAHLRHRVTANAQQRFDRSWAAAAGADVRIRV